MNIVRPGIRRRVSPRFDPHRCPGSFPDSWRSVLFVAAALICPFIPSSTLAQNGDDAGRWWWDAWVDTGYRYRDVGMGTDASTVGVRGGAGVNGYILHPSVAAFRAAAMLGTQNTQNGSKQRSNETGFSVGLDGFPRGKYPFGLSYGRNLFDDKVDGDFLTGRVDTRDLYRAALKIRHGPLIGMRLNLLGDRRGYRDRPSDERQRFVYRWNRRFGRLRHGLQIQRLANSYGLSHLDTDDYTVDLTEGARLGSAWDWNFVGFGVHRETTPRSAMSTTSDFYRLGNLFARNLRVSDRLVFQTDTNAFRVDEDDWTRTHGAQVRYDWQVSPRLAVIPQAAFRTETGPARELTSPQVGLQANWIVSKGRTSSSVSGSLLGTWVDSDREDMTVETVRGGYGVGGSVTHRISAAHTTALDVRWTRNDFEITRDPILELPDLGLDAFDSGITDRLRARARLRGKAGVTTWETWAEFDLRSVDTDDTEVIKSDRTSIGASFTLGPWGFDGNVGSRVQDAPSIDEQIFRFINATATWRLNGHWQVHARYNFNEQDQRPLIDQTQEWAELFTSYTRGRLRVIGRYWAHSIEIADFPDRTDEGLEITVGMGMAGWLPMVTGTKRYGVIK